MFSTGLIIFVICFCLGVSNAMKGRGSSATMSGITGWGVIIGIILILISVVIKLWEVLP